MSFKLVADLNKIKRLSEGMRKIPENFQREQIMMAIFKRAAQPLLSTTESLLYARLPNLAMSASQYLSARKDKTGTIMRVGMVAKKSGKLGFIFDEGTEERVTLSGWHTGRIKASNFWRDAVAMSEDKVKGEVERIAEREINKYFQKHLK
jgi:pyridoxine/pyridoxamine 5'-phosphate oxidase